MIRSGCAASTIPSCVPRFFPLPHIEAVAFDSATQRRIRVAELPPFALGPRQNRRQRVGGDTQAGGELAERLAALGAAVGHDDQHVDVAVVIPVAARLRTVTETTLPRSRARAQESWAWGVTPVGKVVSITAASISDKGNPQSPKTGGSEAERGRSRSEARNGTPTRTNRVRRKGPAARPKATGAKWTTGTKKNEGMKKTRSTANNTRNTKGMVEMLGAPEHRCSASRVPRSTTSNTERSITSWSTMPRGWHPTFVVGDPPRS